MPQLTLFSPAERLIHTFRPLAARAAPSPASVALAPDSAFEAASHDDEWRNQPAGCSSEHADSVQIDHECERILDAFQCESHDGFVLAIEPLLTADERTRIRLSRGLPHQLALAYDRVVERLTFRWAELNQWPVFGRIVEPGELVRTQFRACVLELAAPSRSLAGRVAFRVERDLGRVASPIPAPVLRCIRETWGATFSALAYLEPLYDTRDGRSRRLLRSIAEVRQCYAAPIDPLIVGWLGAGPKNYGLPGLVEPPAWGGPAAHARHSSLGDLVFLLGHWD